MKERHVYVVMFNRVFEAYNHERCTYNGKVLIMVTTLYPVYMRFWDAFDCENRKLMVRDSAYLRRQRFWFDEHHVFTTLGAAKQYYHDNYP